MTRAEHDTTLRLALLHSADVLLHAAACRMAAELIRTNGGKISAELMAEHVSRYRTALLHALEAAPR